MNINDKQHAVTRTVRAGVDTDRQHGAVMPPLYLSSNYSFTGLDGKREYDYSRSGNPTRDQLGDALASLEGGAGAVVTNTGMSAAFDGRGRQLDRLPLAEAGVFSLPLPPPLPAGFYARYGDLLFWLIWVGGIIFVWARRYVGGESRLP